MNKWLKTLRKEIRLALSLEGSVKEDNSVWAVDKFEANTGMEFLDYEILSDGKINIHYRDSLGLRVVDRE